MDGVTFDRASGIGGSDVAAILGISPWRSPFDVYLEKTRDPSWNPALQTARMRLGLMLEPVLRAAYAQDHPGLQIIPHPQIEWHPNGIAYAHLDGIVDGLDEGIWEGKSASTDRDWKAGVPDYYEAQVRQYLAITAEPWCDLTVLFLSDARFEHFRIEAKPDEDDGIIEIGRRFWEERVLQRRPPEIDGSDAAARWLAVQFPERSLEPALIAPERIDALGEALRIVHINQDQLAAARDELENKIKEAMGEHARIRGTGWSALWKPAKGATKVGWEQVAKSYRASVTAMRGLLVEFGAPTKALEFFTDEALDAILSLYTTTGEATHPFRFTDETEGQDG